MEKQSKKRKYMPMASIPIQYTNSPSLPVEKLKETHGEVLVKNQKKKLERDEEKLKNDNRDLSLVKMKSMFATGFAFTALLSMFNR